MSEQVSYDIAKLIEWQKQGYRQVDINIGSSKRQGEKIKIWVFDFILMEGTFLDNPDSEIDLQAVHDEKEKHELARLTEKYRESEVSER